MRLRFRYWGPRARECANGRRDARRLDTQTSFRASERPGGPALPPCRNTPSTDLSPVGLSPYLIEPTSITAGRLATISIGRRTARGERRRAIRQKRRAREGRSGARWFGRPALMRQAGGAFGTYGSHFGARAVRGIPSHPRTRPRDARSADHPWRSYTRSGIGAARASTAVAQPRAPARTPPQYLLSLRHAKQPVTYRAHAENMPMGRTGADTLCGWINHQQAPVAAAGPTPWSVQRGRAAANEGPVSHSNVQHPIARCAQAMPHLSLAHTFSTIAAVDHGSECPRPLVLIATHQSPYLDVTWLIGVGRHVRLRGVHANTQVAG